ncbi:MAG TPA: LuxR C-terminal-related transcriptional regulator [Ktedonobacterales bacterium]|nr:LuxR C-terminal-related transcriptional regulator [Ktedonobacterales bacterium]
MSTASKVVAATDVDASVLHVVHSLRPAEEADDPALRAAALDRVALLLPAAALPARRDPLDYALAYVEQHAEDVVQLEREWNFLCGALDLALRRERHAIALRIAIALAYPAGRRGCLAEGEHVVRLGIEAARHCGERRMLGLLVNRLGDLRFARGHYRQGWRLWRAGLEIDRRFRSGRTGWWAPRISFATSVDLLSGFGTEPGIVDLLDGQREHDDAEALAVALFIRGFQAHRHGQRDRAFDDVSAALRLCTRAAGCQPSESWHVLSLTMQTELARLDGQDDRARACAQAAIALARVAGDRYTTAALITDQALYAYFKGQFDESRTLLRSLDDDHMGDPLPLVVRGRRFLAENLAKPAALGPMSTTIPRSSTQASPTRLSERETEVLRMVAAGHSTRAIAAMLIVTPATVKKHLEHIYARLDAHSRTAAIAAARSLGLLA